MAREQRRRVELRQVVRDPAQPCRYRSTCIAESSHFQADKVCRWQQRRQAAGSQHRQHLEEQPLQRFQCQQAPECCAPMHRHAMHPPMQKAPPAKASGPLDRETASSTRPRVVMDVPATAEARGPSQSSSGPHTAGAKFTANTPTCVSHILASDGHMLVLLLTFTNGCTLKAKHRPRGRSRIRTHRVDERELRLLVTACLACGGEIHNRMLMHKGSFELSFDMIASELRCCLTLQAPDECCTASLPFSTWWRRRHTIKVALLLDDKRQGVPSEDQATCRDSTQSMLAARSLGAVHTGT